MKTRPIEDDPNDSAIVELVEDIVDAVKQAVDSVVDAIKNALKSIAEAFVAAVNFTVAQMANLAKALLPAGERSSTSSRARSRPPSRTRSPS